MTATEKTQNYKYKIYHKTSKHNKYTLYIHKIELLYISVEVFVAS